MSESNLKMYFVCDGRTKPWYNCVGILSNGFVFAQHITSVPSYAPADLYVDRPSRQRALNELFGIDSMVIETELVIVNKDSDIPDWWYPLHDKQDELEPVYARYMDLIDHTVRN